MEAEDEQWSEQGRYKCLQLLRQVLQSGPRYNTRILLWTRLVLYGQLSCKKGSKESEVGANPSQPCLRRCLAVQD